MRNDMYKIIVERPRKGGGMSKPGRAPRDPDDHRLRESLRQRHNPRCKHLNENLGPLRRYLQGQAGRPWDAVYAELCRHIDRRNTVQQHIHLHLRDFVAMQVREDGGELFVIADWGGRIALADCRADLYVDPRNGCLMRNIAAQAARAASLRGYRLKLQAAREGWQAERRTIDAATQLHRIGGIWYRVELAPAPRPIELPASQRRPRAQRQAPPFDAVLRTQVGPCNGARCRLYGRCAVYARRKRQLSQAELSHYGLRNGDEPDAYRPGRCAHRARRCAASPPAAWRPGRCTFVH